MIDFESAIKTAKDNAQSLIQNAYNFELEGVLLSSDDKLYEVSLSYDIDKNPVSEVSSSGLSQLAKMMSYRRGSKLFLIDSHSGAFKGFKNDKNGQV